MPVLGKSSVSISERNGVVVATWLLPFVVITLLMIGVLQSLISYHPVYHVEEYGTDPVIALFRLSVVTGLLISGALVLIRRISLALIFVVIPLGFFVNVVTVFGVRWQEYLKANRELGDKLLFSWSYFIRKVLPQQVDAIDFISLSIILFLVVWYVRILIRDARLRTSELS
ncbi:MAG TPA: hypothetical protein VJ781_11045 [Pyrinomonadaceae bacterium]|nr:hypothetical protein [Pyrinomonadaceae bacterium]